MRAARESRYEGDRRGEDQRARRGDDEYRHSPTRSSANPGETSDDQRHQEEAERVVVGETDERRLRGFRLRDEAHDARVRAVTRTRRGAHVKGATGVHDAAANHVTQGALDGQRFSGERRFIQHGRIRGHRAVDRNQLSRGHHQQIARRDRVEFDHFESPVSVTSRRLGSALHQCLQLASRLSRGPGFQGPAGGQHDADDGRGEILANGDGATESEESNDVHAKSATTNARVHPHQRANNPAGGNDDPDNVTRVTDARTMKNASDAQRDDREAERRQRLQPRNA